MLKGDREELPAGVRSKGRGQAGPTVRAHWPRDPLSIPPYWARCFPRVRFPPLPEQLQGGAETYLSAKSQNPAHKYLEGPKYPSVKIRRITELPHPDIRGEETQDLETREAK